MMVTINFGQEQWQRRGSCERRADYLDNNFQYQYIYRVLLFAVEVMQNSPLIQQIDHSLKSHYHEICFNPEKRDILHRLSSQRHPPVQQQFLLSHSSSDAPQLLNNHLLNNYIQYVYHKYQIEDPIHKEFRLSNQQLKQAVLESSTPKTQTNGSSYVVHKPESTKSKLEQMRRSYKEDSSEILYSTHFHGSQAEKYMANTNLKQGRPKEIGYKTKQKIQFKNLVNKERSISATPRQSHSVSRKEVASFKGCLTSPKAFAETETSLLHSEVPVVFRYCPMCEEVVLQHNIPFHQTHCPLIQQAYQLPLEELQRTFSKKVEIMVNELGDQMKEGEEKKIEEFRALKERLREWLVREDAESFTAVKEEYNKVALSQYYLVTKLNWFKHLQRRIIKERQLQASQL